MIGYDESDGARRALEAARSLLPGRELIAVTVPDGDVTGESADTAAVETLVLEVGRPVRGPGAVADALARFAAERKAALIVVGSRDGRRGARSCSEALPWQCYATPSAPSSPPAHT